MSWFSTFFEACSAVVSFVKDVGTVLGLWGGDAFDGGSTEQLVRENKTDAIKKRQDCVAACLKKLKSGISQHGETLSENFSESYTTLFSGIEKILPMVNVEYLQREVALRADALKGSLRDYLIDQTDIGCPALELLCEEIKESCLEKEEIEVKIKEYFNKVVKDGVNISAAKIRKFQAELNQLFMKDYERVEQLWGKDIEDKRQQLESYRGEKEEKQTAILKGFADIVQGELVKYYVQADLV